MGERDMKIKSLIFAVALMGVAYGSYLWGWYHGVAYNAVASAIAHSEIDLMMAKALRKHDLPEALRWSEIDLYSQSITLGAFKNHAPKNFAGSLESVSSRIETYKSENKTDLRHQ
jgi:hypothetical protein